ncbi:small-conductance mechanosensitive channel/CRP-like cAMP-binding protein [Rhizobium sp. BK529]|uniref:mechanosensitive ion channel family protein n=1 Tax=unclassified Rhizobium TaxID=2613769 RepID=UPI001045A12C|nr:MULTISPECIES: mechanosensitive ion channel family protein [unclassified Rhizobium]MBB3592017.1 small-conductance mechanosensitive channel/CRP-like cAMP-binding protein [Rhizobium sp. BK529]TCS06440.1 small-conductance mechanosensitive channel [Rhizobium sp. BK418]
MSWTMVDDPLYQFIALVLLSAVARFIFGRNPTFRLIANFVFFALLTWLLIENKIAPYTSDMGEATDLFRRIFVGVAKAVWWIGGAMVLASSVRLFLIFERKPREARLLQDLVVAVIYVGAALSVVAYVFGVPVATLIATSGVFAIVLGLALQSTLNDVFSGIALNLGRHYSVGDWIVLDDGVQGRVVETNWRSTHLLNGTNDLVIVPNSALAKARLTNLTSPEEAHGISLKIRVVPTISPAAVEETMRTVLLSSNAILKSPAPVVSVTGLDSSAIEFELSFRVSGLGEATAARNEVYDLVYRHAKAAGLQLASPAGSPPVNPFADPPEEAGKHLNSAWRLLNAIPLFSTLTEDEKESLAADMKRLTFRKDALIATQDTSLTSLMIVRRGVAVVERKEGNEIIELARIAPGDLFGERGVLMGALEPANIRALTSVVVYEIAKDHLATIMQERPALAEELGLLLSRRIESEKHRFSAGVSAEASHPTTLTTRIRHLFQIPHNNWS